MGLRLPVPVDACLFDLDGVLTKTADVHATAWKQMFDDFLQRYAARAGEAFVPFDAVEDYDTYVDGRPRLDGTRDFLRSRGIDLPEGSSADSAGAETVQGLSRQKNELVLDLMRRQGVHTFPGSVRFVDAARAEGLGTAVVSSSANTAEVLSAAGIAHLFDVRIDGLVAAREHLAGKPAPDTFLAAAALLQVPPARAAVFEDALAGVAAGRDGAFGLVVGVDRVGQADELRAHGADVVVADLSELLD